MGVCSVDPHLQGRGSQALMGQKLQHWSSLWHQARLPHTTDGGGHSTSLLLRRRRIEEGDGGGRSLQLNLSSVTLLIFHVSSFIRMNHRISIKLPFSSFFLLSSLCSSSSVSFYYPSDLISFVFLLAPPRPPSCCFLHLCLLPFSSFPFICCSVALSSSL